METDPQAVLARIQLRMWKNTALLSMFWYVVFVLYQYLQNNFRLDIIVFTEAVRATAAVMIVLSFAMSGLCYFFNFLDRYIAYRKEWGVMGLILALIYSISLLFTEPATYLYGFWDNLGTPNFFLGLTSMAILVMMFVITNVSWIFKKIGPHNWRKLLRLGYVALCFLVIRAYILEKDAWLGWLQNPLSELPPLELIISTVTVAAFILRISIDISKSIHNISSHPTKLNSSAVSTQPESPPSTPA